MRATWTLPAAIRICRDYLKEIGVKEEKGSKEIEIPTRQSTVSGERPMRLNSVTMHIVFGLLVGATPDGRHARTTLSQGVSPAQKRPEEYRNLVVREIECCGHAS